VIGVSEHGEDDMLLVELGRAVRAGAEVPAGFVAAGKAAFTWRNVDAELAALGFDSAVAPAAAGTRAEQATLRALTFVASRLTVEVEVTADALLGQVVPPTAGEVEVHGVKGPAGTAAIDEIGWFVVRPVPARMVRLHLRTTDGQSVLTPWVTL
jgi:hypothetical protein